MSSDLYSYLLFKSLYQPATAFEALANAEPKTSGVFFRYSMWLLLLPPVFALIGASNFGWRVGADEPIILANSDLIIVSTGYFVLLVFGLFSTALISQWMATTYGADTSLGKHVATITIVGEPLAVASSAHLFPDVFFNMLILLISLIWAMYLLYKGLPVALGIPEERGMLMASSLVAWLLVAAVSLLGISMTLWTAGFGPLLGV